MILENERDRQKSETRPGEKIFCDKKEKRSSAWRLGALQQKTAPQETDALASRSDRRRNTSRTKSDEENHCTNPTELNPKASSPRFGATTERNTQGKSRCITGYKK
jgi:hypothetical protein